MQRKLKKKNVSIYTFTVSGVSHSSGIQCFFGPAWMKPCCFSATSHVILPASTCTTISTQELRVRLKLHVVYIHWSGTQHVLCRTC